MNIIIWSHAIKKKNRSTCTKHLVVNAIMAAASSQLASFRSQARGIKFYDVPISAVSCGQSFECFLEPDNLYDGNCIGLRIGSQKLGHLAKEDARYLAALLREGFEANG